MLYKLELRRQFSSLLTLRYDFHGHFATPYLVIQVATLLPISWPLCYQPTSHYFSSPNHTQLSIQSPFCCPTLGLYTSYPQAISLVNLGILGCPIAWPLYVAPFSLYFAVQTPGQFTDQLKYAGQPLAIQLPIP